MKQFRVFFKIFGKQMKTTITAETSDDAIRQVKNRLEIIECREISNDKTVQDLMNMFGMTK